MTQPEQDTAAAAILQQQAAVADHLRLLAETANGHRLNLLQQGWDEQYAIHFAAQILGSQQASFMRQIELATEKAGRDIRGEKYSGSGPDASAMFREMFGDE